MGDIKLDVNNYKINNLVRNSCSIDLEWMPYNGEYKHDKTRLGLPQFLHIVIDMPGTSVYHYELK
jgi:hypothetical protein